MGLQNYLSKNHAKVFKNQPGPAVGASEGLSLPTPASTPAQDHTERLPGVLKAISEARTLDHEIFKGLPAMTADFIDEDIDNNYVGMYRTPLIKRAYGESPPKPTGGSDFLLGPMHTHPLACIKLEE